MNRPRETARRTADEILEIETTRHIARSMGVPFVDLEEYRISNGILRRLAHRIAIVYRCVPMIHNRRRIVLVLDDPSTLLLLAVDPSRLELGDNLLVIPVLETVSVPSPSGSEEMNLPARRGSMFWKEGARRLEFALTTRSALDITLSRGSSLRSA